MLSIICVYNKKNVLKDRLLNSLHSQNYNDYEEILVDSVEHGFSSASEALNYGGNLAKGDYLIFLHQDIVLEDKNVLSKIADYCDKNTFGCAGVAGFTVKNSKRLNFYSNIVHGDQKKKIADDVQTINQVREVYSLDECVLIIPKNVFEQYKFRYLGETWHMYALDYALQMQDSNQNILVFPIKLWHCSDGKSFNLNYFDAVEVLCEKSRGQHQKIYTIWGKWPTNSLLINLKIMYRKARYRLRGY